MIFKPYRLLGRFTNGSGGFNYHALPEGKATAICGAKPAPRSLGWSPDTGDKVTCVKCLRKLGYSRQADTTIAAWMRNNGLSVDDAAIELGINRRQLAGYASGSDPTPRYMELACKALIMKAGSSM